MADLDPCEICRKEQAKTLPRSFDGLHQDCPRCGEFKVSGTAGSMLQQPLGDAKRALLSGWVREQNAAGAVPMVSSTTLKTVLNRTPPSVVERAHRLLFEAERGQTGLGEYFNLRDSRFLAATYSAKRDDLEVLIRILKEERLAQTVDIGGQCEILPKGYIKLEELRKPTSTSTQAFVAMWFEPSLLDVFDEGLQKAIFQCGYDPLRIDRVEHINRIDDEIIRQIDASRGNPPEK